SVGARDRSCKRVKIGGETHIQAEAWSPGEGDRNGGRYRHEDGSGGRRSAAELQRHNRRREKNVGPVGTINQPRASAPQNSLAGILKASHPGVEPQVKPMTGFDKLNR